VRIGLQTWGSDGDVRPFIALGGGLVRAGHRVTLVVASPDNKDYGALCDAAGVTYRRAPESIAVDHQGLMQRIGSGSGLQMPRLMKVLMHEGYFPALAAMEAAALQLAEECELLVGHFLLWPLRIAAIRRGLPYASVAFWPGGLPGPLQPLRPLPSLGPWLNRAVWAVGQRALERVVGPEYRQLWARHGLDAPPFVEGGLASGLSLVAASPLLCREPLGRHQAVGALRPPPGAVTALPEELERFLSDGPPPLFFSLGSTSMADADRAEALQLEVADRLGMRALIHLQPGRAEPRPPDDRVRYVGRMQHEPLHRRSLVALHHGGAGTTHSALSAGIPAVVLAMMDEQFSWGERLAQSGVGTALRYQRVRSDARQVAEAVRRLVESDTVRNTARALGRQVDAEDGVARAVALIEQLAESRQPEVVRTAA